MTCACGCGIEVSGKRKWVSGHNLRCLERTAAHRERIAEGQRMAWKTKRQRMPIGSKWIDGGGYVRVKIAEGKGKWKLEHVMVMEKTLGRSINQGEIVHHIDGVRSHNAEENLHLCHDHAEHMWLEKQIKGLFREMLRRGFVTFNRNLGVYECQ